MTTYQQPKTHWTTKDIPDLTGKIALISGGSSGIGLEAARALAEKGAEVHLSARNAQRGQDARDHLIEATGNRHIYYHTLDLSSLAVIKKFSEDIPLDRLDILINSAGLMMPAERSVTVDGFEMMWATNYLGGLYLTIRLLTLLKRSEAARVVNLTSLPAGHPKIDLTNVDGHNYSAWTIYLETKLAQAQIARKLDQVFTEKRYPITMMAANPGVAATNLVTKSAGATSTAMRMGALLFRVFPSIRQSAAEGALPTLYAATDSHAQGGAVYSPNNRQNTKGYPALWKWNETPEMTDQQALDQLLEESLKLLKLPASVL